MNSLHQKPGELYAFIIIGIETYLSKEWGNVNNAQSEAETFLFEMKQRFTLKKGIDPVELYNKNATKEKIEEALVEAAKLGNAYNLILYFAGHGTQNNHKGYIVPHDGEDSGKKNCISYSSLFNIFRNSHLHHILFIFDCCHASKIILNERQGLQKYQDKRSRWVLISGYGTVKSSNNNRRNVFSRCLVDAIKDTYADESGSVLFEDIYGRFRNLFSKRSNQIPHYGLMDIPDFEHKGGQMVLKTVNIQRTPKPSQNSLPSSSGNVYTPPVQPSSGYNPSSSANKNNYILRNVFFFFFLIVITATFFRKKSKPNQDYVTVGEEITKPRMNPVSIYSYEYSNDKVAHQNTERQDINVSYSNEEKSVPNTATLTEKSIDIPQDMSIVSVSSKSVVENIEPIPNSYEDIKVTNNGLVNVVFVGHFESKENAENWLASIKKLGYQKAEIVMKDKSPYFVVVTGLHYNTEKAKNEVRSIKQKGIDVFYSLKSRQEIFRESH